MSELLDMQVFKLSKIANKDLPEAIKRVENAIKVLHPYRKYKAISGCIVCLIEGKGILDYQLKMFQKALKEKGRIK